MKAFFNIEKLDCLATLRIYIIFWEEREMKSIDGIGSLL